jgi:hypothetical protein
MLTRAEARASAEVHIKGPNRFTKLVGPDGRRVCVFGESHGSQNPCARYDAVNIDDLMDRVVDAAAPSTVDVFIEARYTSDGSTQCAARDFICQLQGHYQGCLHHMLPEAEWDWRQQPCHKPNVRAHLIDVRQGWIRAEDSFFWTFWPALRDTANGRFALTDQHLAIWSRFVAQLESREELAEFLKRQVIANNVLWKELQRSSHGHEIYAFFTDMMAAYVREADFVQVVEGTRVQNWREVYISMSMAVSVILDMYTMARVFKRFADGNEPRNVVTYGGFVHARQQCDFLRHIGFQVIYETDQGAAFGDQTRCLILPKEIFPLL